MAQAAPTQDHPRHCIEVHDLSYQVNGAVVLDNLTFSIDQGDYVGILGANGSGKTTLLKLILGLLQPTYGTVRIAGKEIKEFDAFDQIGYVPQRAAKLDRDFPATVEEVVASGRTPRLGLFRMLSAVDRQQVEDALRATDILDLRKRMIGQLSGGERQRVYIARALAGEPHMLILDEPTASIDAATEHAFYEFLEELNEKKGITIILVSHDIESVTKQVKTVLCLNRELVCHLPAQDFIMQHHLERMYGKKGQHILHRHEHTNGERSHADKSPRQ
jgi:zinc transport system ATP-binding protein